MYSVKGTIERYKKATSDNSSAAGTIAEVTIQVTSCRSVNTSFLILQDPSRSVGYHRLCCLLMTLVLYYATFLATVCSTQPKYFLWAKSSDWTCTSGHYTAEIPVTILREPAWTSISCGVVQIYNCPLWMSG